MSDYLHWVGWQLYLLLFWPTRFAGQMGGERQARKHVTVTKGRSWPRRMLYAVILLTMLLRVLGNQIFEFYQQSSSLVRIGTMVVLLSLVFGPLVRMLLGFVWRFAFGVAFAVPLGLSVICLSGLAFFLLLQGTPTSEQVYLRVFEMVLCVSFVFALAVALGVLLDTKGGIAMGIVSGVLFGAIEFAATPFPVDYLGSVITGDVIMSLIRSMVVCVVFTFQFYLVYFRLCFYPSDLLLTMIAYGLAKAQPSAAFRWWRRCPVAWNEVIYLPLPGAAKLLALATRQNREEGFNQIAFVAAERKLQRRVAEQALTEVALGDLEASATEMVSSAPDRLAWTSQSWLALPEDFNLALPRFERAAHQASQFMTLSSSYRKADALKRSLAEVDALQKTLIASRGKLAPRLLQIANRWRELLAAEQAGLKQLAAERRETPNPFIFGNPVDEQSANVFAGRQDVARQIEESLLGARQSPALLLHGPRRMGKSSILKQLPRLLGPDFAPALLDCQNPAVVSGEASNASLLRYLSASLSEGLQRRRVAVKPLTAEELAREPFGAFDAWLARVEQAMPLAMRALLCLDEYERLQRALDAGWGGDFLDALRHTLQHRPRFVLLFTGAHTFAEMGPAWTDRFISARRVRVSFLQPDDVRPLLTKPIPEFDLTYAPGALDAVIAATRCQPFLVQAVAFELVQYLNEPQQQRKEATPADVETAITRALESGGEYFANVWSDAGAEGQAILRKIASGRSAVVGAEVTRLRSTRSAECGVRSEDQRGLTSAATAALKWLREHDVLDDAGRFAVPMVERWVREQ